MSSWACPDCTYENAQEHLACLICGRERVKDDPASIAAVAAGDVAGGSTARLISSAVVVTPPATMVVGGGVPIKPGGAPAMSFAALAAKAPVAKPSSTTGASSLGAGGKSTTRTTSVPMLSSATALSPSGVCTNSSGDKIELREYPSSTHKQERRENYHFAIKDLPGTVRVLDIGKLLDAELQPFSIKRVSLVYYEQDQRKVQKDVAGPSSDENVHARALVEMYPAKGLTGALRKIVGFGKDIFAHTKSMRTALEHCAVVPFFPSGKPRGEGGKELCPHAHRVCKRRGQCPLAHEPEDWGVVRFDGASPEESISPRSSSATQAVPAPLPSAAAAPKRISPPPPAGSDDVMLLDPSLPANDRRLQENILLLKQAEQRKKASEEEAAKKRRAEEQAVRDELVKQKASEALKTLQALPVVPKPAEVQYKRCCNGCGEDRPASMFASPPSMAGAAYCLDCVKKGVPKTACARCWQMRFGSELLNRGVCRECVQEEAAGGAALQDDARTVRTSIPLNQRHHVRLDFPQGVVLSSHEVICLLEPMLGKLAAVEIVDKEGTPVACRVSFARWDYARMAPTVRELIPPLGVSVSVDDLPTQARVEQLWRWVEEGALTNEEVSALEQLHRGTGMDMLKSMMMIGN